MGLTRPRAYQIFDLDYKQSVRVITTTNITLTGGAPATVDGVSLSGGDRVLVSAQNTGSQNGLYQVSILGTGSDGTWIRSVDGNETGEIDAGMIVMVTEGEVYKDTQWKLITNDPIIIGTTALVFEQNSAFAFGNIYANGTAVLADIVGDTVTFTPANNLIITGNATSDTITFEISQSPDFTGNFVVSGTVGSNLIPTANVTYDLGNVTNRWNDLYLSNSTIYLGNAQISANATSLIFTNPQGAQTVFSGTTANVSASTVTATGNITGGNLVTAGQANVGTLTVNGGSTFTGNLLPSANITYNIGSPTQRWNEIYLAGNTIDIGGATISADLETGSLVLKGPDGAEFILTGSSPTDSFGIFGLIEVGNASAATSTNTGALRVVGGAGIGGNIFAGGLINAVGNVTGGNLITGNNVVAIGNITAGEFSTSGNVTANYFLGNVACASGIFTTKIFNGNSEANIISAGGNLEISIGGTADIVVVTATGLQTSGTLTATGNITGSNLNTAGQVTATGNVTGGNISGTLLTGTLETAAQPNVTSVGTLTSLTVTGNVSSGNISGTRGVFTTVVGTLETAAQPNITSVGTLTTLTTSGNAIVGGNLIVNGDLTYINISDLNVEDPIIGLGRGANNTPLTSDDGKDRGEQLWYYNTSEKSAFIGYDNSADKLIAALDVTLANEIVTVNSYGSFVVGGLEAATGSFTGNVTTGNISGTTGTFTNVAGTLATAAQPNVTSVGTLTSLTVTGNIAGGNVSGTLLTGTLATAAQPNVTSVGTLTSLSVTGNVTGGNLNTAGQVVATGNVTGGNLQTSTVTIGSTGAVSGITTLSASGNANVGNIGATAGVFTGAVTSSTTVTATGNITGGNIVTAGQVSATGNVTGNFFNGNGSALTGISAFGTIVVAGSDNVVADSTSDTLTLVAGDGVVITTAAGTDTITISTSGSSESIFITGGDMGTVTEIVTQEQDLGVITDPTALEIDMGFIVVAGVLYPDQLVLPSYTVTQLANLSVIPAGQFVFCSNESGGSIPAFSDGTNWRRVSDRAVVT